MKRILMTGLALALSSGIAMAQTVASGPATYDYNTAPATNYGAGATQHSSAMPFSQPSYSARQDQVRSPRRAQNFPTVSGEPFDQTVDGSMEGGNN